MENDLHFSKKSVAIGQVHMLHMTSTLQFVKELPIQLLIDLWGNMNACDYPSKGEC